MDIITRIYEFLAGPCLFITIPLCVLGLARKTVIILSGRRTGLRFPAVPVPGRTADDAFSPAPGILEQRSLALAAASTLFHVSIIAAPLSAAAHCMLFDLSWHVLPPYISPAVTHAFTALALLSGAFLLARRSFVKHVLAVSSWRDYAAMVCVLAPFATGFLAREMIGTYETVMLVHCAASHVLLIAIGWTRLGHMVFFTAGRMASSLMRGAAAS